MKEEILELRAQLSKKETLLQSTAERLQSTSRLKENMEHFIISHCRCSLREVTLV